jgi:hypothetical protein
MTGVADAKAGFRVFASGRFLTCSSRLIPAAPLALVPRLTILRTMLALATASRDAQDRGLASLPYLPLPK